MGKTAMIIVGFCLVVFLVLPVSAWPAILDSGISKNEGAGVNMWGIGERKESWETGEWEQEKDIVAWIRIPHGSDWNPVDDGPQFSWESRLISPQGKIYRELSFPVGFMDGEYGVDSWVVHQLMREPGWEGQWTCEFYLYDDYTDTYQLAETLHFTLLPNTITPWITDTAIPENTEPTPDRNPVTPAPTKTPLEWPLSLLAAGFAAALVFRKIQ